MGPFPRLIFLARGKLFILVIYSHFCLWYCAMCMHGCGGDVGDTLLVLVLMLVLLLMVVMVRNTLLVLVLILGLLLILVIILAMVEIPCFHCPDSRHQRSLKTSTCWVVVEVV